METIGTLNLKITRLEYQLKVLKQRLFLSSAYPEYCQSLIQKDAELQARLSQLITCREQLLQHGFADCVEEKLYYANVREIWEDDRQDRSLWPTT
jgi:hypothetical protein